LLRLLVERRHVRQIVPEEDMTIKLIATAGLVEAETGMKIVKVSSSD